MSFYGTPERPSDPEEWRELCGLGDYTGEECKQCGRERVCLCPNGKHRCEKCNWCPETQEYELPPE